MLATDLSNLTLIFDIFLRKIFVAPQSNEFTCAHLPRKKIADLTM